jgi:hypothetical protein
MNLLSIDQTERRKRSRRATGAIVVLGVPAAAAIVSAVLSGPAAVAQGPVKFDRDVWPILESKCVTCHGPEDQFNDLRLDSKAAILKGGKNGKVVVAGDPAKSSLYVRVALPPDDLDIMPAEGDPLSPAQIDTLKRWITDGADFGSWTGAGG